MRRGLLFSLLLCNAIWSANPIAGKILLAGHPALEVSWLRSASTLITAWLLVLALRVWRPRDLSPLRNALRGPNLLWIAALGLISFFGSAILQILGLAHTTATANVVIIATEPLIATLLAFLFLKEHLTRWQLCAFAISLAGFLLLSNLKPGDLAGTIGVLNKGNLILLVSMTTDSMYSIIARKLAGRVAPVSLFAYALPFGFFTLTAYTAWHGSLQVPHLTLNEWLALLYIGPLGTALTYAYWSVALAEASVAAVSLTLFAQPIIGTVAGVCFLGDRLDLWQTIGAVGIGVALYLQTRTALKPHP